MEQQPDTFYLPYRDKGYDLLDVQLPQYYREGFFSKDSLFHPELQGGRYGVAGDPIPYSVRTDNVITGLLMLCFVLAVISFSNVRSFLNRQARYFFYVSHGGTTEVSETANEMRFQVFLLFLTSLLLSLLFYFYTLHAIGENFILKSPYHLIFINLAVILLYFFLHAGLYTVVNSVFFDGKRNGQWIKSLLFITSIEGVLLFPAVIVQAYFHLAVQNVEIYFIIVLLIVKLLTIFKCYVIFFRQNVVRMQIILYLCALEIVPLITLWSSLVFIANSLKINL